MTEWNSSSYKLLENEYDRKGWKESNYRENLLRAVLSTTLGCAKFMKDRSNMRTGGTNPIVYWFDATVRVYEQNEIAMLVDCE